MMLIDKKGCRLCAGSFKSGVRLAFINQMIEMDKYGRNDYFLFVVVFLRANSAQKLYQQTLAPTSWEAGR